jgi:hypothetical protein
VSLKAPFAAQSNGNELESFGGGEQGLHSSEPTPPSPRSGSEAQEAPKENSAVTESERIWSRRQYGDILSIWTYLLCISFVGTRGVDY